MDNRGADPHGWRRWAQTQYGHYSLGTRAHVAGHDREQAGGGGDPPAVCQRVLAQWVGSAGSCFRSPHCAREAKIVGFERLLVANVQPAAQFLERQLPGSPSRLGEDTRDDLRRAVGFEPGWLLVVPRSGPRPRSRFCAVGGLTERSLEIYGPQPCERATRPPRGSRGPRGRLLPLRPDDHRQGHGGWQDLRSHADHPTR